MNSNQYSPTGFKVLPPVVKNLLIINGLFYLATLSFESAFGIDLVRFLGLYYVESEYFQPYQFVTYMFLHANFGHILWNMFALWMFGYLIENVWGSKRFLTYYMVTGIGAAIIQTLINWWNFSSIQHEALLFADQPTVDAFVLFVKSNFPSYYEYHDVIRNFISEWTLNPGNPSYAGQSVDYTNQLIQLQMNVPTIGASGAVYGILLAFGMMFPNMLVYVYFLFPIKAKWIVIIYGALELFSGISNNPSDNVAHFAHLGGMIFGFFMIYFWKKRATL
ncbi:MAG: rhomboid family intramembrane serine protease [Bacteroidales bacterium]|nr:rhomboid family intramembrane serine protease [Bacteroidales bacterium]